MLAPVTHLLPLATFRRNRLLPVNGHVLVRTGQKVNATDVIAEAQRDGQHFLIDIRRALNISNIENAEKLITRHVGEQVQKGDILALIGSVLPRVVRAPVDGEIVAINNGQILLEGKAAPFQLLAGFTGGVVEVIPDRGAVIEASGALIQGVWGNRRVNAGTLQVVTSAPDDEFLRTRLDMSMRGAVILAGYCANADALQMAGETVLRGLILSSMNASLIPLANSLPFPVILLEGFGRLATNAAAFRILRTNEKRDICLNSAAWNSFTGDRPEVFIPLPAEGNPLSELAEIKPGKTVRVVTSPYASQVGVILDVQPGWSALPNGVRARTATVRLDNNEQVRIPLANLDVLE